MIEISNDIKKIMDLVKSRGYEIYLVGGFVRDSLLGVKTNDVDMTTNATPNIIKDILKDYKLNDEFRNYGCIKLEANEYNVEITTYRKEYDYKKHRRPSIVEFVDNLKEDLKRRDFTINALCYDGEKLVDLYDGIKDLNNKVIRTIGDPLVRFEEDALRILRALRFSSALGFQIEDSLLKAINQKCYLVNELNKGIKEREIKKIQEGKYYEQLLTNYRDLMKKIFASSKGEKRSV